MLSPDLATTRLFLHLLAATVWVGGQLTLAGLVPALRRHDPGVTRVAARAFNRVAWPAFGVLVATGAWNLLEAEVGERSTAWQVTLFVKLVVVAVSGGTAFAHSVARSRAAMAVFGALTGVSAVAALWLGVLMHG
jgi:putative copper export protein